MLEDRTIIVTGGGSGIGEGAAKVMARYGARIVIGDMGIDGATRVAAEIEAAGGRAVAQRCDITRPEDVAALVEVAVSAFGRLDGAFNNAGILGRTLPAVDMEVDDWTSVLGVDLIGTWDCIRQEIRAIRTSGGRGALVNNASGAGLIGSPNAATYGAAKAGLINLTKTIAIEYGPEGIRCNAICPGTIETPPVLAAQTAGADFGWMTDRAPLKRLGTVEEVGELVAWLLSDKASFITGQAISVDGGFSASF